MRLESRRRRPGCGPTGLRHESRGRPSQPQESLMVPRILEGAALILLLRSRVAAVDSRSFWTAMKSSASLRKETRGSRVPIFTGSCPRIFRPTIFFALRFSPLAIHRRIRQEIRDMPSSARGGSPRVVGVVSCRNTDEAIIAEPLRRIVGDQLRPRRGRYAEIFRCSTPRPVVFWDERCLVLRLLSALRLLQ
jgi:hypothetical protein